MVCASCESRTCFTGQGNMPDGCPELDTKAITPEPVDGFLEYAPKTREKGIDRITELIEYAHFREYKKIGIAACIGLHDELRIVADRLKKSGLKVSSVMCKTGSLKKKEIGVPARYRMTTQTGYGIGVIACNPASILYGFYGDNFFTRRPSPEGSAKFNSKHITPFDIFRMIRKKMRS